MKKAKVIGICQLKGGTGRSTLATNLGGMLGRTSKVLLVDCDMPQGSTASWYSIRSEGSPEESNLAMETATSFKELDQVIEEYAAKVDFIVLDAPPRIEEMTKSILVLSDLVLIPIGASMYEIWATNDLIETIQEAKKAHPKLQVKLVWNRFRNFTNSAKELAEAISDLGLEVLRTKIGFRVAYPDSASKGKTVAEWRDKSAKQEMNDLVKEVKKLLIK